MKKRIRFLYLFVFLFFNQLSIAQIQGLVSDESNKPIEYVTVVLKKVIDSSFVAYSRTDATGFYKIQAKNNGSFFISFSMLGYAKQSQIAQILQSIN